MNVEKITLYLVAVGLIDSLTGLALIAAPTGTLKLMMIALPPAEPVFLQWIGVFVTGVGLTCFMPWLGVPSAHRAPAIDLVLLATAMIRALVCAFVTAAVLTGKLEIAWVSVALTDGALAIAQLVMWRRRYANA